MIQLTVSIGSVNVLAPDMWQGITRNNVLDVNIYKQTMDFCLESERFLQIKDIRAVTNKSKMSDMAVPLKWRHNGRDGVQNHQPRDC